MSENTFNLSENVSSMYLSTFNMNGANLTIEDAKLWLLKENSKNCGNDEGLLAHDADLVILSLQECPTYPDVNNNISIGKKSSDDSNCSANSFRHTSSVCISVLGPPKIDENKECDELQSTIQEVLSKDHVLMADIAMGEPPTSSKSNSLGQNKDACGNNNTEKWFGFIRLMIYAKSALATHILSWKRSHNGQSIIPIMAPVGRKRTSTYPSTCHNTTEKWKIYKEPHNMSPDKGGVCIAIPSLRLLICSLHLCGTNKYHTLEHEFDSIRIKELIKIGQTCRDVLEYGTISSQLGIHSHNNGNKSENKKPKIETPSNDSKEDHKQSYAIPASVPYQDYKKIILGDLNFRVEICKKEKEKGRGGRDFQLVMDAIMSSSNHYRSEGQQEQEDEKQQQKLDQLFWSHDRLVQLLQQISSTVSTRSSSHNGRSEFKNQRISSVIKMEDKKGKGSCCETVKNKYHYRHDEIDILKNIVDVFMEYFAAPVNNGTTNKVGMLSVEEESSFVGIGDSSDDDYCRQPLMINIPPTFTFIIPDQRQQPNIQNLHLQNNHLYNMSRIYSDKRTPSWTDRILIDKRILNKNNSIGDEDNEKKKKSDSYVIYSLATHPDILISDHIALSCMLTMNTN